MPPIFLTPVFFSAYFWHVSDFHVDFNYSRGGGTNGMSSDREYYIGDYEYDRCWTGDAGAGSFGSYDCDAPTTLVESAINFMAGYETKAEFVIWTGQELLTQP